MIGITNCGAGGGVVAFVTVTYPVESTCTATNGTKTLSARDTSGTWIVELRDTGSWTFSCTNQTESDSKTITVAAYGSYQVVLQYESIERLQREVNDMTIPALISTASGDYSDPLGAGYRHTRTSSEPIILVGCKGYNICVDGCITFNKTNPAFISQSSANPFIGPYELRTNNGHKLNYFLCSQFQSAQQTIVLYTNQGGSVGVKTKSFTVTGYTDTQGVMKAFPNMDGTTAWIDKFNDTAESIAAAAAFNEVLDRYALLTNAEAV